MTAEQKSEIRSQKARAESSEQSCGFFLLIATLILLPALCLLPQHSWAAGEPDAFALGGIGARAGGMGNAAIGLSDGVESVYYNPAGLGNLVQSEVTAMVQTPTMQTSRGFLAGSWRWKSERLPGSVGAGWLRLRSADIELTSTDEQVIGSDDLTNDLFFWGAGVHPWSNVSLGASMKYFRFEFNGFRQAGAGVDLGAHVQFSPFRFGVALTDVGGTMVSGDSVAGGQTIKDKIPMRIRPGVGVLLPQPFSWPITAAFDIDALFRLQGDSASRLFLGGEVWMFQDRAAFRTGFQQGNGPTFGFGARWWSFQLDYAFLYSLNLKDENRISLTYRF